MGPSQSTLIYFFKTPDDAYKQAFETAGWRVQFIPVLSFQTESYDRVKKLLGTPDRIGAIALTSPRAASVLMETFELYPDLKRTWQAKQAYVVGEGTADILQCSGLELVGAESGRAALLAERIIASAPALPVLFFKGNLSRDTLPKALADAGVACRQQVVYWTMYRKNLSLSGYDTPDWVAFYSPSGFEAVRPYWPKAWEAVRIAAIGPTTSRAISEANWTVSAEASAPEPASLLQAIDQVA